MPDLGLTIHPSSSSDAEQIAHEKITATADDGTTAVIRWIYSALATFTPDDGDGQALPVNAAHPLPVNMAGLLDALGALATTGGQTLAQASLNQIAAALAGTLTVNPQTAGDVATALNDSRKVPAAAGTPEAIRASLPCKWVTLQALTGNANVVYVGGSTVHAASGSERGQGLQPGAGITIPVANASLIYIDARTTGDGVTFTVGT